MNVGLPMALRLSGAVGSRGPWTPKVTMTMSTVAIMDIVQGHDAQETNRILCGTHIAHIAMAATTVKTIVQVACSLTVSRCEVSLEVLINLVSYRSVTPDRATQ